MPAIHGVWAASITPFSENLSVNPDALIQHVKWLLNSGCHGVVLLGTTGEANSMSVDERLELLDSVAASGIPLDRIIVGTGCTAHADTVALTARARALGFRAVLLLPPFYYKNVSDDGLFESICNVVGSLGSDVPDIILYHFPAMAGAGYSEELIERLRMAIGDPIVGVKDSTGDIEHTVSLIRSFPDLSILAGNEVLLPEAVAAGGAGCISASINVTAALSRSVYNSLSTPGSADLKEEMDRIRSIRNAVSRVPMASSMKAVLAELGELDRSAAFVRPPLVKTPLSKELHFALSLLAADTSSHETSS